MTATYNIMILSPTDETVLALRDFVRLEVGRAQNSIGRLTLVLQGDYPFGLFQPDNRILVYRQADNGLMTLLGKTHYFIDRITRSYASPESYLYTIEGVDSIGLLDRRLVAYLRDTDYADKTIENLNDGPADDLMKAYVRENFGPDALDSNRNISSLIWSVAGDRGLGTNTERRASFRSVLSTLSDLARGNAPDGKDLIFDFLADQSRKLLFDVWIDAQGTDRTLLSPAPVVFTPESGSLIDPKLVLDYSDSVNYVYVGGFGDGAGRLVREVSNTVDVNASPWARREYFEDQRDYDVASVLDAAGESVLAQYGPKVRVEARGNDVPGTVFGTDYYYGDRVSVVMGDYQVDAVVRSFRLSVQEGSDQLDVQLRGETDL